MDNFNIAFEIHNSLRRKTFRGWSVPLRTIADHELVLITSGSGSIRIKDREYTAQRGMLFYFSPGVLHSLSTNEGDMMSFYAIHFDSFSLNPGKAPELCHIPIEEVSSPPCYNILKNLFKSINDYRKNRQYGYELACTSLFGQLIFEIMRSTRNSTINYSALEKTEAVIDYINGNIGRKITLNELAEVVCLNSSYLSQLFKSTTGYGITEFINRRKIDRAKELLTEGSYRIREIAALLGYDDPYYFSRLFKNTEGISPTGYYNRYINPHDTKNT